MGVATRRGIHSPGTKAGVDPTGGGVEERATVSAGVSVRKRVQEGGQVVGGGVCRSPSRGMEPRADNSSAVKRKAAETQPGRVEERVRKACRRVGQVKAAPFATGVQALPDDVLEVIFGHIAGAASPREYFNAVLTCKRFSEAGMSKRALSQAGEKVLAVRASNWHKGASTFAAAAVHAGSVFATFFVGSVKFYCTTDKEERRVGAALLAKAAVAGSPEAHHTLAIMHFNGSGGKRKDKDPEAGAALCARGNILFGSIPAKRELGHCLQDGFGVEQDAPLGRRLLAEAAREDMQTPAVDAAVSAATTAAAAVEERLRKRNDINTLNAAVAAAAEVSTAAQKAAEAHLTATPENRFLLDWYGVEGHPLAPGTHACSHPLCGRVETRRHEFRRCSCCGRVRYCSRSCQSMDWRLQHKFACLPLLELYGWIESDAESTDTASGDFSGASSSGGGHGGASSADVTTEADAATEAVSEATVAHP